MAGGKYYPYAIWAALFALFLRLDPSVHEFSKSYLQRFDALQGLRLAKEMHGSSIKATSGDPGAVAEAHTPKITILSFDPLIAHVADFLSPSELTHLKQLS